MIKTLIFDLGGVFVHVNPESSIRRLRSRFPDVSEARVFKLFEDVGPGLEFELGRIDADCFYRKSVKELGIQMGRFDFESTWNDIFDPIQPMIDLLPLLKPRFRLVMLSNTNPHHFQSIGERWPFYHHFNDIVLSYDVGAMKPDRRMFEAALKRCGSPPEACVFFDDRRENVLAAEEAGFASFVFHPPDQIRTSSGEGR